MSESRWVKKEDMHAYLEACRTMPEQKLTSAKTIADEFMGNRKTRNMGRPILILLIRKVQKLTAGECVDVIKNHPHETRTSMIAKILALIPEVE